MVLLPSLLQHQSSLLTSLRLRGESGRACLAILLRLAFNSSSSSPPRPSFQSIDDLRAWILAKPPDTVQTEVLFIKRAANPRDRWENHVGFPGGRANPGETEQDALERECLEEIGVDLKSGQYALLGRLNDRVMRTRKPLVISTFLYAQLDTKLEVKFKLAEKEIADAFWVNSRRLLPPNHLEELSLDLSSIKLNRSVLTAAKILGVHALRFPCLHLKQKRGSPSSSNYTSSNSSNSSTEQPATAGPATRSDTVGYALWGLTFGIVSDLLGVANLPTLNERRPRELGTGSTSAKPFRTNSIVANLLLEAYYTRNIPRAAWLVPMLVFSIVGAGGGVVYLSRS